MQIIPAIDLKGGRCVRLVEGRADSAKVYDGDPVEVARSYQTSGALLIHVVDLDGAFLGSASDNQETIGRIARELTIPIEVGGGIRSLDDIRLVRDIGARYVILGTLAVERPDIVEAAVKEMGGRVVVAIDARGSQVSTRGWTRRSGIDASTLAKTVVSAGVRRIIYTDITRDGKLEGPNLRMTRQIALDSGVRTTASGGVSSLQDIRDLCEIEVFGVDSCIVGKALYEGRFTLEDAILAGGKNRLVFLR
jgi:phosphoribosylformimino-5-aminoimidazole carboxamide ribotide isomerase